MPVELGGVIVVGAFVLAGGILFSRFLSVRPTDGLPAWVQGVFLALLLVPFALYAGAKLVSIRIALPALIEIVGVVLAATFIVSRLRPARSKK